ncbi:MAG: DNA cytosine methyltransferase [Gemmatimonadota bacterium]|nr:DNA cytosine methyltransferase [Gemmatimonadota bacterium]
MLRHSWPGVPKHTDVRHVGKHNLGPVDLICGGFPCQDLSVAGKRAGLAGERSGLFHEFMRIVDEIAPAWVLIENVPGLLSSNGGRDMGTVLGTLGQLGYGWTYRVLNAEHWGVPQRRRRVFIVGRAGGVCPPEILFEPESLRGDTSPRREAREGSAGFATCGTLDARTTAGGFPGTDGAASGHVVAFGGNNTSGPIKVATACNAHGGPHGRLDFESETFVLAFHPTQDPISSAEASPTLGGTTGGMGVFAIQERADSTGPGGPGGKGWQADRAFTLEARHRPQSVIAAVPRRLTPKECERLMGWPDQHTRYGITDEGKRVEMADGPRYRMCGNGVVASVAKWIARRIVAHAQATELERAA